MGSLSQFLMVRVWPMRATAKQQQGPRVRIVSDEHKSAAVRSLSALQLAGAVFNWCTWLFIMLLVLSQVLTAVFDTTTSQTYFRFGQDVERGLYQIPGSNDEPYSDRVVVCVRRGHNFKAVSLNDALGSGSTIVEDYTGSAINGYRVVHRTGYMLSDTAKRQWTQTCRLVNDTLDGVFQACTDLGYTNLTRDSLRIMDGNTLTNVPNALPFLIMPYWDDGPTGRNAIPAWDGHACIFRLHGQYEDSTQAETYLAGVNRTVRETKTVEWLGRPGGQWKNGWYEDTLGMRWYSDILSMEPGNTDGLMPRYFDPSLGHEVNCLFNSKCSITVTAYTWTSELASVLYNSREKSIAISNGTRFGLFYYGSEGVNVVTCVYEFSALISNASVILLLCRWMIAMLALHRGYSKRVSRWHSAGLGSIAHAPSFTYLPIAMLPRMKMILAAFYTVGCDFEGEQKALSDAWFIMYPSIVDLVLVYASLLNMLAKLFRRRLSDSVFPFTIVALSAMHFFRQDIAASPLLHVGGRMTTIVDSEEFQRLTWVNMLSPDVALPMGGGVSALLWVKLLVLSLSCVSLLLSNSMALQSKRSRVHESSGSERALKIRACNVGGIGRSNDAISSVSVLNAYELARLGYLVLGGRFLISTEDWLILSSMKHVKSVYSLWNHRVLVFQVHHDAIGEQVFRLSSHGRLMSIHDPVLNDIAWWDIDARPVL